MKTITGHDDNRLRHITTNSCAALLIGFATVIAGCSNDRQHSSLIEPTSVLEIDKTNLSQIVDSIRFIPLETSEMCLIGRIQKIKRRNDRFYIQADGRLMVFDGQGQFENTITEIGDGPDQVVSILDYDVSSDGDIAVSTSDKIVIYGLDGTLKKKIEHTYGYCSLRHTRDGWLAVTSDRLDNGNRMIAYNANWDTIHTMMPSPDFDGPNSNIDLIPLANNVYFHQIGSGNEMFEYNYESGNSCQYRIIESPDMMSAQEYADYHGDIMESPKNIIRYITNNKDNILLGVIEKGSIYYYLYDKNDRSAIKLNIFNLTDDISGIDIMENPLLGTIYSFDSDDEYFVSYLFGTQDMNAKFTPDFITVAEHMDETNPILVLTKFKTVRKLD